ncbi:virulence factor family protein [Rhizobium sp. PAMB 3174]
MTKKALLLSLALATALPLAAQADWATVPPATYDTGMIPSPHIARPDGDISAMVFLISGQDGWSAADDKRSQALVADGAAVVGIDYKAYMASLAKDDGDCIYMISDIESLSQQVQRAIGNTNYHLPILAGEGAGGALVLAMIAQSPFATIGEAITVDPTDKVPLTKQLCTPADKSSVGGGIVYGLTDGPLPAPVTVMETDKLTKAGKAHVDALVASHPDIDVESGDNSDGQLLTGTVTDHIDAQSGNANPLGLPLTELPTTPTHDTLAIVYSGDGGWRDIDMQLGTYLQAHGIPTVGVDSLKYFWSERSAQETASDLARIIETYRKTWKVKNVLLVGYSFGADILPAAYDLLSPAQKAEVKQVSLLALSHEIDYVISVTGWLGAKGAGAGGKSVDAVEKIDPKLIQCMYGTDDDDDDACPDLKPKGYETIAFDGGHHFDGNYEDVGKTILDGLTKRLGQ